MSQLTLDNLSPDSLQWLESEAASNNRSIADEARLRLEEAIDRHRRALSRLEQIRTIRPMVGTQPLTVEEIEQAIAQGRE